MTEVWYIVQSNPGSDKKAAREMRRRGFGVHVPRAVSVRIHHRTGKPIMKRRPLMTGYLFLRFKGPENWYRLRQCQGVKGVLYIDGHPFRMAHDDVLAIIRAQRSMAYDDSDTRSTRRAMHTAMRKGNGKADVQQAQRSSKLGGMSPGRHIRVPMSAGERVLARIEAITKKGTVKAFVIIGEGDDRREIPVEFTDIDAIEFVDDKAEAA